MSLFLLDENGNPITFDGVNPIIVGESSSYTFLEGTTTVAAPARTTAFYPIRPSVFAAPARPEVFYARS